MSLFTEIVKSALGNNTPTEQTDNLTQNLLSGAMETLESMGGIEGMVNKFQQSGLGDLAASWVGPGDNKKIKPEELTQVLGEERITKLEQQSGIPKSQGAQVLSQVFPAMVNELTPEGKAPEPNHLATLAKVLLGGAGVAVAAKVAASYFGGDDEEPAANEQAQTTNPASEDLSDITSTAAPTPSEQFYTVMSGDSLSKIAQSYYHDANQWHRIFDANRDILNDPDRIVPGQKLRIP